MFYEVECVFLPVLNLFVSWHIGTDASYVGCFQISSAINTIVLTGVETHQCIDECFKLGTFYAGIRPGSVTH